MRPLEHLADRSSELQEVVAWVAKCAANLLPFEDLAHGSFCAESEFTGTWGKSS